MGKFRFETLLKLREATQDEKKNAFLDAEKRRKKASEELAALDQEIFRERETSRQARENVVISNEELRFSQERRIRLSLKRKQTQERLNELTEEAENKRLELDTAMREVKILQNLKDKAEERETEEAKRLETKTLDELAARQKTHERRQKEDEEES